MVKKGYQLTVQRMLKKLNTEFGILFVQSLRLPFLVELTKFTCLLVPKCCTLERHQEQQCLMSLTLLDLMVLCMQLNFLTDRDVISLM
mmetsp:Transcript_48606/g.77381  ORF Transcript_48606/g.77381 Transcript_48606/m.77381 type:complete len:88 (+) Transcript_48606:55-318(+)